MIGRRKTPEGERTEQERAAALAERMRRRGMEPATAAAQARQEVGEEPPPPPRPPRAAPPEAAPTPARLSTGPEPGTTRVAVADPAAPQPAPERPATQPPAEPAAPQPAAEPPPVSPVPEPAAPQPAPEPQMPPEPAPAPDPELPPAASAPAPAPRRGPRRTPGRAPKTVAGPSGPRRVAPPLPKPGGRKPVPRPRAARAPRRPLPPAARAPSRTGRRVAALGVLLFLALLAFLGVKTFQPFHDDPGATVAVTIPEGADAGEIGDLLAERGVVDSGTFFSVNATLTGRRGGLQPGDYELRRGMSYGAALEALSTPPKAEAPPPTFKLTIPEGLARTEVAGLVRESAVRGDYRRASASDRAIRRARRLGLPRGVDTTEGFLFPATYDLLEGATAADLVDQQLEAFADNTADVDYRAARRANLSRYEILIIASMVERETQLDRERPLVAAVIWNRLREGMPLGIDATIRYAEDNWTRPLRVSELERPGPYNTRLNSGLPPTPIGNPGLASIEAAAGPADVDYLFYVVKPGTKGHAFSSTDAQFQRDRERYDAAREANGGNSPTP